uniref:Uncharacterized protein n=1 Tax=Aegilops tauschii subsp. strangulata TaxID=200361 RepID=A0A452ZBE2_AEGTS
MLLVVSHPFTFVVCCILWGKPSFWKKCCILNTSISYSIHAVYGLKKQTVCIFLPIKTIIFNWFRVYFPTYRYP